MDRRGSGILLHISSLPSPYGIGDFGPGAYAFADFLKSSGQKYWQVLPLNPTSSYTHNSPYSSISSCAGNTILISPELLVDEGFLTQQELPSLPRQQTSAAQYEYATETKEKLFKIAYKRFITKKEHDLFDQFCIDHAGWLDDFALFVAIKEHMKGISWNKWPDDIKNRETDALKNMAQQLDAEIQEIKFLQYIFFTQWSPLKKYCNEHKIKIIGDIPFYVSYDSADVWANPHLFKLNDKKKPVVVAGVPPDYFSSTGQRWGNPIYNWEAIKKNNFSWWMKRFKVNLKLFDIVRIDHFRGLSACWEIPVKEKTAVNGSWVPVPGYELLNSLLRHVLRLPLIAEDLGYITNDVRKLIKHFKLPGMKLLQFAFDDTNKNPYLPHNHIKNCVVYTGTHDNNTLVGWINQEASKKAKDRLLKYLNIKKPAEDTYWAVIQLAMKSVADTVIIPLQDILRLDAEARMNRPGTVNGNWEWRLMPGQITPDIEKKLYCLTKTYNRI